MSSIKPEPMPIAIARQIAAEHDTYSAVLDVLESKCASFALDDETDREQTAIAITTMLMQRGMVKP